MEMTAPTAAALGQELLPFPREVARKTQKRPKEAQTMRRSIKTKPRSFIIVPRSNSHRRSASGGIQQQPQASAAAAGCVCVEYITIVGHRDPRGADYVFLTQEPNPT